MRVLPAPFSWPALGAESRAVVTRPVRYLDCTAELVRGSSRSPLTFLPEMLRSDAGHGLARAAARDGVTHVHAHFGFVASTVAYVARRVWGLPYSVSVHAWDVFVNRSMLPEKLVLARKVVTCTEYARRVLLRRYRRLDPAEVVCVRHGVDLEAWRPSPPPAPGPFRVLAVGRLERKKGFDVLLRAAALARRELEAKGVELAVAILGDGPERRRLASLASSLGLEGALVMPGRVPNERVRDEMARCRVVAAPSVRGPRGDLDGLPNVVLEAMASARAVAGSRLSGIPEAVADGVTGLLTRPGDPGELARALVSLALDPGGPSAASPSPARRPASRASSARRRARGGLRPRDRRRAVPGRGEMPARHSCRARCAPARGAPSGGR
jgi:glycosyltransferase involved in cell wall biosynthesis